MPFVEAILYATKNQSIVRCKICTKIKKGGGVLVPKWDSLEKYVGKKNNEKGSKHDLNTPFETLKIHSCDSQIHLFLIFPMIYFRFPVVTLALGSQPRQRGLQCCKPRGSLGVTPHAPESVGKCEGMNPHTP